jgi:hypothetical protein
MKTRNQFFRIIAISLAMLMLTISVSAQPRATDAVGTSFTYQGSLSDGGSPAEGSYDFEFRLYEVLEGGTVMDGPFACDDVTVNAGLFTVQLDFGDTFDGSAMYLEISVRPGASEGGFTTLIPRQEITPTPYAIYAYKSPWSGLTGVPSGFTDGVDNGSAYQNVVVVAKSGGDYTTIQGALDSITDSSDTNRYLVYVAPGVYTERVTMVENVDIQGSGELTTKITYPGDSNWAKCTLMGSNNAEVRFLTVENTGGDMYAVAVFNPGTVSLRFTHVTATALGGTNFSMGMYNYYLSSVTMMDFTISASGGNNSYGVYNYQSSSVMKDVTVSASGGSNNYGIYNSGGEGPYTVEVNNSQITGGTNTIYTTGPFTVRIGASLLSGGATSGTMTCAGVYDENYTFYPSTCP